MTQGRGLKSKEDQVLRELGLLFVRVPGLEPGAFWFVAKRSIQLGYIRSFCVPKYSFPWGFVKGKREKKSKKFFIGK